MIASKFTSTSPRSRISATIGCVEGSWSCSAAWVFSSLANVAHTAVNSVTCDVARVDAQVANDSLSQRSFHHRIVTELPNHMWLSSCSTTIARCSRRASETRERNR